MYNEFLGYSESELSDFRETLEQFENKFGLAVSAARESVDDTLAEFERSYDDEAHTIRSPISQPPAEQLDEEDIRNLFRTLM